MTTTPIEPPKLPRGIAISGIIFSMLYVASLVLLRIAVVADPGDSGAWLADSTSRTWVSVAINVVPFAGLTFLWFMAVLRNHIGMLEDRFFATVLLGSGLLFIAMLFTAAAISRGLLDTFEAVARPGDSEAFRVGRRAVHALMNVFGVKMAAAFMFATSMIGLRTGALARWLALTGFALALMLLFIIAEFAWIGLVFPIWVLMVSTWILCSEYHGQRTSDFVGDEDQRQVSVL